jgi:3-isopropylmalate dehydrogenase
MISFHVAVLPGDGIGPEVTAEGIKVLRVVEAMLSGVRFVLTEHRAGAAEFLRNGDPLPASTIERIKSADAILLGAMGLPDVRWPNGVEMTPQLDLREQLDLYSGIRPIRLYHAAHSPLRGCEDGNGHARKVDMVIVRENCEGLFSARLAPRLQSNERETDTMLVSRRGAERICRTAFRLAQKRRRHCTLVDKANVLPSMVFFRKIFDEIAADFPDVQTDHVYVDAMALFLIQRPDDFDVVVTENMFGDILSDLAAGLVGGMGMAASADLGDEYGVFQPAHGTAPALAGKAVANPIAAILSVGMMLDWLDHPETVRGARMIESAVARALANPANATLDLGGRLSTTELTAQVVGALRSSGGTVREKLLSTESLLSAQAAH